MLKNQLNNNSAYDMNSPEVAVKDDLDGGQPVPVEEDIEDMSENYDEDFDWKSIKMLNRMEVLPK